MKGPISQPNVSKGLLRQHNTTQQRAQARILTGYDEAEKARASNLQKCRWAADAAAALANNLEVP